MRSLRRLGTDLDRRAEPVPRRTGRRHAPLERRSMSRAARVATPSGWPAAGSRSPRSTSVLWPSTRPGSSPTPTTCPSSGQIGDVTEALPEGRYDLVALFYLHLARENAFGVIDRATAAVAPAGTLLIVGHHVDNIEHGYGGPQDPSHPPRPPDDRRPSSAPTGRCRLSPRLVSTDPSPSKARDVVALDSLVRATRIALD